MGSENDGTEEVTDDTCCYYSYLKNCGIQDPDPARVFLE